jgi:MinD-like ATPase involved in chromosome partitioning or flagellar assembly
VAVLAFCSAKGAPGVTTTALLTAALWPRPVLTADCDPDGGDIALRLPDPHGAPLDPNRGLLTLLPHARRQLDPSTLHEHTQHLVGGIPVLAGLAGPEQAEAAGPLWNTLATALADLPGTDVVIDAGRTHGHRVHLPVLRRADTVVWVVRPQVSDVVHLRERLHGLEPVLARPDGTRPRVGVAVVAPVDARTEVDDVARSLRPELPWVELFGHIALDPRGALIFNGAGVRRPDRTMLVRSGHALVGKLIGTLPQRLRPLSITLQQVPLMVQHAEPVHPAPAHPAPSAPSAPRPGPAHGRRDDREEQGPPTLCPPACGTAGARPGRPPSGLWFPATRENQLPGAPEPFAPAPEPSGPVERQTPARPEPQPRPRTGLPSRTPTPPENSPGPGLPGEPSTPQEQPGTATPGTPLDGRHPAPPPPNHQPSNHHETPQISWWMPPADPPDDTTDEEQPESLHTRTTPTSLTTPNTVTARTTRTTGP